MTAKTWKTLLAAGVTTAAATLAAGAPAQAQVPSAEIGQTHETPHFRVTARSLQPTAEGLTRADVEVCAKVPAGQPDVRVSWDPWSLREVDGDEVRAGGYEGVQGWETYPYADGAPQDGDTSTERYLSDGECASGAIGFAHDSATKQLVYRNGYDETLVWNLDS